MSPETHFKEVLQTPQAVLGDWSISSRLGWRAVGIPCGGIRFLCHLPAGPHPSWDLQGGDNAEFVHTVDGEEGETELFEGAHLPQCS